MDIKDIDDQIAQLQEKRKEILSKAGLLPKGFMFSNFNIHFTPTSRIVPSRLCDAIRTLVYLRQCTGTLEADSSPQFLIGYEDGELVVKRVTYYDHKIDRISPCFKTEHELLKAIDDVGRNNIIAMFKTLHGGH